MGCGGSKESGAAEPAVQSKGSRVAATPANTDGSKAKGPGVVKVSNNSGHSRVVVTGIQDLPREVITALRESGLDRDVFDRDIDVLANVLRFTHKLYIQFDLPSTHPCYDRVKSKTEHTEQRKTKTKVRSLSVSKNKRGSTSGARSRSASRSRKAAPPPGVLVEGEMEMSPKTMSPLARSRLGGAVDDGAGGDAIHSRERLRRSQTNSPQFTSMPALPVGGHEGRSRSSSHHSSRDSTPRSRRSRASSRSAGSALAVAAGVAGIAKSAAVNDEDEQEMLDVISPRSVAGGVSPRGGQGVREADAQLKAVGRSELGTGPANPPPTDKYKVKQMAGKGGYGRVFEAEDKATHSTVAIKRMPHTNEKEIGRNCFEVGCLKTFMHPSIVKYISATRVHDPKESVTEAWVFMEFLQGGTLSDAAGSYDFQDSHIAFVAQEMLAGIKYLHDRGFAHRDLKSQNVMMSVDAQIKLIDFGLCARAEMNNLCQMVGSPFWMPPEMIRREPHGLPVDIWSLAVSLIEMSQGKPPNKKHKVKAMFIVGTRGLSPSKKASPTYASFLRRCLVMDPAERATAEDMLKDPFLEEAADIKEMKRVLSSVFFKKVLA